MCSVFQTITVLKGYFGYALWWFLALFARAGVKVDDVERASTDVGSGEDTDMKSAEGHDLVIPAPAPEVEIAATEPEKDERTGPELFTAAVAASLSALPSLPSILKSPVARPPSETSPSAPQKQDFGPPTNLFYEHRLPFGNVTNLSLPRFGGQQKPMRLDNLVVTALPPRKVRNKAKAKKAKVPVIVVVDTDAPDSTSAVEVVSVPKTVPVAAPVTISESIPASIPALESVAAPVFKAFSAPVLESVSAPVSKSVASPALESVSAPALESVSAPVSEPVPTPVCILQSVPALDTVLKSVSTLKTARAPGPADWDRTKSAALAEARTFSDHVKTSRRISLPAPARIPVPAPATALVPQPLKRHSAPPVLGAPRKTLQDRLSALLAATTDTIAALGEEKVSNTKTGDVRINSNGVPEIGDAIEEARRFSAAALEEGREVFTVGEDSDDEEDDEDDEDEDDIPLSRLLPIAKARQDVSASVLPTVNPASPPRLISSISASRSMAGLAHASSRSVDELLDGYDAAMNGMGWRRLVARSDDIDRRRRNDSIV